MCFEGGLERTGTVATEPERAGSSVFEPAELATSYSSEFEAVEHHRRKGAADAETHLGLTVRKVSPSRNPVSGSGPSESARPWREQTVEGEKDPEDGRCRVWQARVIRISTVDVAEGVRNPRRGDPTRQGRRRHPGLNPEGAAKLEEAAARSSDRVDGCTAEHLEVVETTWRERRTNDAATTCGALREARETP
jgi:hypothetical protein